MHLIRCSTQEAVLAEIDLHPNQPLEKIQNRFGFVSLLPKTQLIKHYKEMYGFEQLGRYLAMDLDRSRNLIEKYLQDER